MSTIINNGLFAEETGNLIQNPIFYVPDPEKKGPLAGAQMFFGLVGTDPEIKSNQKKIFALQEDKAAYAMDQPVITSGGGVPQLNGNTVSLAIVGSYSLKILNSKGGQEDYFPSVEQATNQGFSGVIAEESQTVAGSQTLVYTDIEATTSSFYISSSIDGLSFTGAFLKKWIDYTIVNSATIILINPAPDGTVVLGREMDPTGQIIPVADGASSLFVYTLKADAIASDLQIGGAVTINHGASVGDKLGGDRYVVVSGGTGTNDNVNYINLNNGNQLELIESFQKFAVYSEATNTGSISGGSLTLDLSQGQVFSVLLTESVTVNPIAYNQATNITSTISLKMKQDPIGGRIVTWSANIRWGGGVPPVVSSAPDSVDRFVLVSDDGGISWDAMVAGQNFL